MIRGAGLVVVLLLAACHRPASGEGTVLWSLSDPPGDDHGDGQLRYPGGADLQPGALDVLELRASPAPGGTLFEVTLARPVAPFVDSIHSSHCFSSASGFTLKVSPLPSVKPPTP